MENLVDENTQSPANQPEVGIQSADSPALQPEPPQVPTQSEPDQHTGPDPSQAEDNKEQLPQSNDEKAPESPGPIVVSATFEVVDVQHNGGFEGNEGYTVKLKALGDNFFKSIPPPIELAVLHPEVARQFKVGAIIKANFEL